MEPSQRGGVYRFDRFTLDTVRGALLAAGGTEVALRPKAFALLVRLVESAGRLIDREEIMRAVWPDVMVTDDSITKCVKEIRRALGDEDQRLVRTLPRRGFLFAAEVERGDGLAAVVVVPDGIMDRGADLATNAPSSDGPPPPPPQGARAPSPASARHPLVTVRSLAAIGGDEDGFAEGLSADLVANLTRFRPLRVARLDPGQAPDRGRATDGGAGSYVVSGAVRRGPGRVRATAQLEDAETGEQVWAYRLDRALGGSGGDGQDPWVVQEEVAGHFAALVAAQVEEDSRRRAHRRPPASHDVYELCLRGRELYGRATEADTLRARALFEQAILLDPLHAPAYAWLAFTIQRGLYYWWGEATGPEAARLALSYARRAVALERDSAVCQSKLAAVLLALRQHDEALEAVRTALRLNPHSSEAHLSLGIVLMYAGEPEAAVAEMRLCLELDPFHPPVLRYLLGRALLIAGRRDEAGAELRQVATEMPDYSLCQHTLAVWAAETGRLDEARAAVRHALRLCPRWTLDTIAVTWPFRDPAQDARVRAAFRAAGLPEG